MARRGITYTQVINWLKVLLPVVALALLSTMFLFSETVSPTSAIPFAKIDLEERARDQRISAPFFSGQTAAGHSIEITALNAKPNQADPSLTEAEALSAKLDLAEDNQVVVNAQDADVNSQDLTANLSGTVHLQSTNGYTLQADALHLDMNAGTLNSATPVTGKGPAGQFWAGTMTLTETTDDKPAQFIFTNGVKLIYTPQ